MYIETKSEMTRNTKSMESAGLFPPRCGWGLNALCVYVRQTQMDIFACVKVK